MLWSLEAEVTMVTVGVSLSAVLVIMVLVTMVVEEASLLAALVITEVAEEEQP